MSDDIVEWLNVFAKDTFPDCSLRRARREAMKEAADCISSLRARVGELTEALQPFAEGVYDIPPSAIRYARSLLSRTLADKGGGEDLIQESSSVVSNPPLNPYTE